MLQLPVQVAAWASSNHKVPWLQGNVVVQEIIYLSDFNYYIFSIITNKDTDKNKLKPQLM